MNLEDNPKYLEYNDKSIRIGRRIFVFHIYRSSWSVQIHVELRPKYEHDEDVDHCSPSSYRLGNSEAFDKTFRDATDVCIRILREIEEADRADFGDNE